MYLIFLKIVFLSNRVWCGNALLRFNRQWPPMLVPPNLRTYATPLYSSHPSITGDTIQNRQLPDTIRKRQLETQELQTPHI